LAQSADLFEILFFSERKVGTATNVTVALGKDTAGTRSAASDKAGKARRAQEEEVEENNEEMRGEEKGGAGGGYCE
jgi:ribosomal protein L12E/L44/L45/RPP1/RPP2